MGKQGDGSRIGQNETQRPNHARPQHNPSDRPLTRRYGERGDSTRLQLRRGWRCELAGIISDQPPAEHRTPVDRCNAETYSASSGRITTPEAGPQLRTRYNSCCVRLRPDRQHSTGRTHASNPSSTRWSPHACENHRESPFRVAHREGVDQPAQQRSRQKSSGRYRRDRRTDAGPVSQGCKPSVWEEGSGCNATDLKRHSQFLTVAPQPI